MAHKPGIGEQLDTLTPQWDELVHQAQRGPLHAAQLHELEERAHAFATAVITAVRGVAAGQRYRLDRNA